MRGSSDWESDDTGVYQDERGVWRVRGEKPVENTDVVDALQKRLDMIKKLDVDRVSRLDSMCKYCVHRGVCKYEEVLAKAEADFCGVHEYPVIVRVTCTMYNV